MAIDGTFRFKAPLWGLLFFVIGANAFGHTAKPENGTLLKTAAHYQSAESDKSNVAEDTDQQAPCKNHSQDPDCNTCPSGGHCHLQATSLSQEKELDFDKPSLDWIHFENDRLPSNLTFEPALRPPIL